MEADQKLMPRELNARPRKAIPSEQQSQLKYAARLLVFGLWTLPIWFGVAALVLVTLWGVLGKDQQAVVKALEVKHKAGDLDSRLASVDFTVDGQTRHERFGISQAEYELLGGSSFALNRDEPRTIRVRTLQLGPIEWSRSISQDESVAGYAMFVGLVLFIGCAVFYAGYRKMWIPIVRLEALYREGLATPGTIIVVEPPRGDGKVGSVTYAFTQPGGESCEAKQKVSMQEFAAIRVGQSVTVLHLDGQAKPSVIYEYGGYRCE